MSELQQALELNPGYSSAYGDLAEQYALQGRTEEALEAARKAIGMSSHDPIEFWRHHSIALAKFAAGNDWGALEMTRKVVRSKPGFLDRRALLGRGRSSDGQPRRGWTRDRALPLLSAGPAPEQRVAGPRATLRQ